MLLQCEETNNKTTCIIIQYYYLYLY